MIKISEGNSKIGYIPNISLPPIITCRANTPCAKNGQCYALKSWRQYPNVRNAWKTNLYSYLENPKQYESDIQHYINKKKNMPYFRFHVGGDIPDQAYLEMMKQLALSNNNTLFLTFTKKFFLNFNKLPKNLNIIMSMWKGIDIPQNLRRKHTFAWVDDPKNKDKRINLLKNKFTCSNACPTCINRCWTSKQDGVRNIIFNKH